MRHTEELWVYMGTVSGGKDGRRYIPVHDLCSSLSKEEGSLAPEFDIETYSGAGYSSSEMVMSLICLLKMPAAACKI
jgi:hypothetical protein